jgi:hypothetical protein
VSARNVACAAIAGGLLMFVSRSLASQTPALPPAAVALTDANFAQYKKSSDALAPYIKAHPNTDVSATDKNYASADEAAKALCASHPDVRGMIAAGGLTCAQFFALTVEVEKAAAFASMFPPGQTPPTASAITVANIAFYRKHHAEMKRALTELGVGDDFQ